MPRFAAWLERGGDGRDEDAPLLAHHYAEAVRPEDVDLAWRAGRGARARCATGLSSWLRRAAELAVGRYEIEDGLSLLHRAVELERDQAHRARSWRDDRVTPTLSTSTATGSRRRCSGRSSWRTTTRPGGSLRGACLPDADPRRNVGCRAARRASSTAGSGGRSSSRPDTAARAKALIARATPTTRSPRAGRARRAESPERSMTRSSAPTATTSSRLTAFAAGDYDEAPDWQRRRVALVGEIDDPDHQADIYADAIAPAVARGRFDEARRFAGRTRRSRAAVTSPSPARRLGQPGARGAPRRLGGCERTAAARGDAVAANIATPCVRNQRSLLVCALARAHLGDEEEARDSNSEAGGPRMAGYGTVLDTPRLQLALHATTWPSSSRSSASRRASIELVLPQLDGCASRRARGSRRAASGGGRGEPARCSPDLSRAVRAARSRPRARGREPPERAADSL